MSNLRITQFVPQIANAQPARVQTAKSQPHPSAENLSQPRVPDAKVTGFSAGQRGGGSFGLPQDTANAQKKGDSKSQPGLDLSVGISGQWGGKTGTDVSGVKVQVSTKVDGIGDVSTPKVSVSDAAGAVGSAIDAGKKALGFGKQKSGGASELSAAEIEALKKTEKLAAEADAVREKAAAAAEKLDAAIASGDSGQIESAMAEINQLVEDNLAEAAAIADSVGKSVGANQNAGWGGWTSEKGDGGTSEEIKGAAFGKEDTGTSGGKDTGGSPTQNENGPEKSGNDDTDDDVPVVNTSDETTPVDDADKPAPEDAGFGPPVDGGDPYVSSGGGGDDPGQDGEGYGGSDKGKKDKGGKPGNDGPKVELGWSAPTSPEGWGDGKGPGGPVMNPGTQR